MKLAFYTKPLCPLCEHLEDLVGETIDQLVALGAADYVKRDINDDSTWYEMYWDRIPVLTCDDKVILEGRPGEEEVEKVMHTLRTAAC